MTDYLNFPLQTCDIRTLDGRDSLRSVVNAIEEFSKKAIFENIVNSDQMFISYVLGYVSDGEVTFGSEGLEWILAINSGYFSVKDMLNSGSLIKDLTKKTSVFIDIAEQHYAKGRIDAAYLDEAPAYVEIVKNSPLMGIGVKISSEPMDNIFNIEL